METIKLNDTGDAVEDVQHRLVITGHLSDDNVTGTYDNATAQAVRKFCADAHIAENDEVTNTVWVALVDASYCLGDRTLYLRIPYFHGHDVFELQQALGALGFFCGENDAIFGAHTELALRNLQMNLGLPSDGIAGAYTYAALHNLEHSWVGKEASHVVRPVGFARAADVLGENALCLYGTDEFTRSVASRMSNVALATNPASKIVSADALSVAPDDTMLLVEVSVDNTDAEADAENAIPVVTYVDLDTLPTRLGSAIDAARRGHSPRIVVLLPGQTWEDAGPERSAQHFAVTLLDALCSALS